VTTFTLRVSDSLAATLSSAKMRASLDTFLGQPHPLPWDPGPGHQRISLTLADTSVVAAAAYLRCSASSALRRIAVDGLEPPRRTAIPNEILTSTSAAASILLTTPNSPLTPKRTKTGPQESASRRRDLGGALIQFSCSLLLIGVWLFFISRKKRTAKGA
jgi:hypothetical protein